MDVGSRGSYPANALSNFTAHGFMIEGVQCASMEGFLQGLKFKSPEMQREICSYIGRGAKKAGSKKNWQTSQILWWRSQDYQNLITDAFNCMYEQSDKFRAALEDAGPKAVFTHSMGRHNENETVLTEREFCSQLHRLQRRMFP